MRRLLAVLFSLLASSAVAQIPGGGVNQSGTVTTGDCAKWLGSGVIADAGAACASGAPSGPAGGALSGTYPNPQLSAARTFSTPAAPTGTSSTAAPIMMGLAGSITPASSGKVLISVPAQLNQTTANDGCFIAIRTGTGATPVNGAAATGTVASVAVGWFAPAANSFAPVTPMGYVTGLAIGTPLWIDVTLQAITGGSCSVTSVGIIAIEE